MWHSDLNAIHVQLKLKPWNHHWWLLSMLSNPGLQCSISLTHLYIGHFLHLTLYTTPDLSRLLISFLGIVEQTITLQWLYENSVKCPCPHLFRSVKVKKICALACSTNINSNLANYKFSWHLGHHNTECSTKHSLSKDASDTKWPPHTFQLMKFYEVCLN